MRRRPRPRPRKLGGDVTVWIVRRVASDRGAAGRLAADPVVAEPRARPSALAVAGLPANDLGTVAAPRVPIPAPVRSAARRVDRDLRTGHSADANTRSCDRLGGDPRPEEAVRHDPRRRLQARQSCSHLWVRAALRNPFPLAGPSCPCHREVPAVTTVRVGSGAGVTARLLTETTGALADATGHGNATKPNIGLLLSALMRASFLIGASQLCSDTYSPLDRRGGVSGWREHRAPAAHDR
jgi:hypothetical protein